MGKQVFIFFLVAFLFTRCVRSVYIPMSQNTPLFSDEKSVKAVAYVGENHIELQGAFNPGKRFAAAGNIYFGSGVSIYDAAAGTYGYNENKKWRWETFLGYGNNNNLAFQTANYNIVLGKAIKNFEVRSFYDRFYLQPAFGCFGQMKMYNLNFSFSFSNRFSALYFHTYSYREIDDTATKNHGQPVYYVNKDLPNGTMYMLEPCITNKVGKKNVSLVIQAQGIFYYSQQLDFNNTFFSPAFIFSIGLQYNFALKTKKVAQ